MPQYRTGTVTVSNGSPTVLGTGTAWLINIESGDWFMADGDGLTYTVAVVISDTEIILTGTYQGLSRSNANYWVTRDFTPRGYAVPAPGDIDAVSVFRRTIYEIDADLTGALGSVDGGDRTIRMRDITDLASTTATPGQLLAKLPDGTYGFTAPGEFAISIVNLTSETGAAAVYAGNTGTVHSFRRLRSTGGITVTENASDITISSPAPGEVNTLGSLAAGQAVSIAAPKTGTVLNTYGLRGFNGVSVVRDGNDIVISGTSTPGGGEANTAENLGATGATVVRIFSDKSGVSLRLRSLLFDPNQFTVTGEASGQYTIGRRAQKLVDSPDTSLASATVGQSLRLESDNLWRPYTPPAPGIATLQADPTPRLGGDLTLSGRRIIGVAGTLSGMIERPKVKSYTLILRANHAISISSMAATCISGSVNFELFLGATPVGGTPISGIATSLGVAEVAPSSPVQVQVGSRLTLRLTPITADAADFSFSIAHTSA
jgi:hypothetical protein